MSIDAESTLFAAGGASSSSAGKEQRALEPGDHFGEIALIEEGTRTTTVRAWSELSCFGITHWGFGPLVAAKGEVGRKLLRSMARMLRAERQE